MAQDKDRKNLNVPPLRFPGFKDEWERVKVSDLFDFYSTNSLSWEMLNYEDGDIQNLHYGLIHSGLPTLIDLQRDTMPFVNETAKPKKFTLCKVGDIAFADASEDTNDVAKAVEFINLNGQQVISGLHTIHGRDNENKTVLGFKGYAFASSAFHNQIRRIAQGTKIYSISSKSFDEVFISIPNKAEQTKIARLLHLIDGRITTQNKIIEDLKKLKSAIIDRLYSEVKGVICTYSELFTVVTERNSKRIYNKVIAASQEYGMVEREFLNLKVQFDEESINTYKIINSGDYVIHLRSFQGGFAFSRLQGICSPAYIILRPNDRVEYSYFENYFTSAKFINSLRLVTYGIRDGRSINVEEWLSMEVTLPSKEEQKRIIRTIQSIQDKVSNEINILTSLHSQRLFLLRELFI